MTRVLACIDASIYAESVCSLAAWAASRLPGAVELLHVVQRKSAVAARRDYSGAIGLGVKGNLLEELTRIEEEQARLAVESGRALLSAAQARIREAGVGDITLTHRHGGIVETILEREADCDLVIMGKRGASHDFATGHLGSKIERVLRASARPTLVAPQTVGPIDKVIIAYDAGASASRGLELVLSSSLFAGLDAHIVMAGPDSAARRNELDAAGRRFEQTGRSVTVSLQSGLPENAIVEYMQAHANGILVMGAYGHSRLRNLIIGSTTTSIIRAVSAPILLTR